MFMFFLSYLISCICCVYAYAHMVSVCNSNWSIAVVFTIVTDRKFQFFDEAQWMRSDEAKKNYNMTKSGEIQVKSPGIYIIHANVSSSVAH